MLEHRYVALITGVPEGVAHPELASTAKNLILLCLIHIRLL